MKRKKLMVVVLSVIALTIGVVLNFGSSESNDLHSIKTHDCSEHLALKM